MLFCTTIFAPGRKPATTTDTGKIRLGGGYRLPETTVDIAKLSGGERRASATADAGKIRLGGGYRLPVQDA